MTTSRRAVLRLGTRLTAAGLVAGLTGLPATAHATAPAPESVDDPGPSAGPVAMASKSLVPATWLSRRAVETVTEWVRGWQPGPAANSGYRD